MTPLINAVYAAREVAAPEIERGYQAARGGFVPSANMSQAKADLEKMMQGIPAGSAGFPEGVAGFLSLGMKILGISMPSQANTSTAAGAAFRKAQADIDWWINRATEAQGKAKIGPTELAVFQNQVSDTFFKWADAIGANVPRIAEKVVEQTKSLGAAGANLAKTAEELAKSAKRAARQVRKLPKYAQYAILGGGVILLGLFGLAALFIATRKK